MNSQLGRAAKACLLSTVTGALLVPGHLALAQAPGRILHADAEETVGAEPAPLSTTGPASPMPLRTDRSRRPASGTAAEPAATSSKGKGTDRTKGKIPARKAAGALPATATTGGGASAAPSAGGIEQTAAQVRPNPYAAPYGQPAPAQTVEPPSAAQPAATMSPIERELQEIYRKNGRQMPDMNMQDYAPTTAPPTAQSPAGYAPSNPFAGRGPAQPQRAAGRSPKPNFFERVFGFGRARQKTPSRTAAPPRIGLPPERGYVPQGPSYAAPSPTYAPQGQPSAVPANTGARPAAQLPPFRPNGTTPNTPPVEQSQPYSIGREPAPLAPAGVPLPERQRSSRTPHDPQTLIDESKLQGDSESLELSQDDGVPSGRQAPQIAPKQSVPREADSPYTGLTINPHESEGAIARSNELERLVEDGPSKAVRNSVDQPAAPSAAGGESALTHPLAGSQKAAAPGAPAPSVPGSGSAANRDDDDELMDLDDEDEDDDDLPVKSPAGVTRPAATDDSPVFPREAAAATARDRDVGKIVAAGAAKGFKGFCPVLLKDERRLVEANARFKSEYRGRSYTFSSAAAKQAFDANPRKYAPAGDGKDVVRLAGGDDGAEGTLEHAAWYRGRLFLFSSDETRREFIDAPSRFNVGE